MAWPLAPFTRLSITAAAESKHVSVGQACSDARDERMAHTNWARKQGASGHAPEMTMARPGMRSSKTLMRL